MKIELQINEQLEVPTIIIQAPSLSEEIQQLLQLLKQKEHNLVVYDQEKIVIVPIEEIYLIRTEDKLVTLYTATKHYTTNKRLYELETILGSAFMRISKTCIINLKQINYVEPSFSVSMLLVMKNGCKDYISRSYLAKFKTYLGI